MAMVDLARHSNGGPVTLAEIAEREEISLSYLEQLFAKLRRSGLVKSVRGPGGGYLLAHDRDDTRIADIILAVDEPIQAVRCTPGEAIGCRGDRSRCLTHDLWEELGNQIHMYLNSVSLGDVCEKRVLGTSGRPQRGLPAASAMTSLSVPLKAGTISRGAEPFRSPGIEFWINNDPARDLSRLERDRAAAAGGGRGDDGGAGALRQSLLGAPLGPRRAARGRARPRGGRGLGRRDAGRGGFHQRRHRGEPSGAARQRPRARAGVGGRARLGVAGRAGGRAIPVDATGSSISRRSSGCSRPIRGRRWSRSCSPTTRPGWSSRSREIARDRACAWRAVPLRRGAGRRQAAGSDVDGIGADLVSLSAHKLGGPPGSARWSSPAAPSSSR